VKLLPRRHDAVLRRITYLPETAREPAAIPWPAGVAPSPVATALESDGSLPPADVLVITWTAAEALALSQIFTPGVTPKNWVHYSHNFSAYKKQLTSRSPAKSAGRLGEFQLVTIGTGAAAVRVCCFHSQLHPATDAATLPTAQLATQIATETGAKLVITTGTAGGGPGTILGDVVVATAVHSDCTTSLKGHSWSQQEWATTPLNTWQQQLLKPAAVAPILAANAGKMPKTYVTRPLEIQYGHCVSVDFFAFYDTTDHYGLLKFDPQLKCEEMDDFAIALGVSGVKNPPQFQSVRCASDPPMPDGSAASKKQAEKIYEDWGQDAAWGSAATSVLIAAGLTSTRSTL
jgi:nucleoside phosphorylase